MDKGYKQEVMDAARKEILRTLDEMMECPFGKIVVNMNRAQQSIDVVMERHTVIKDVCNEN